MGDGVLRIEFDGLLVAGDGLVHLALVSQRIAQVEVGRDVGRGGGDRRLKPAQPLVHPLLLVDQVGTAQRHQQAEVLRPPTQRRLQQLPPPLHCDRQIVAQGEGGEPRWLLQGCGLFCQFHKLRPVPGDDRIPDRISVRVGIHPPKHGTHSGRLPMRQASIQGRHDPVPHHRSGHPRRHVVHRHRVGVGSKPLQGFPSPRRHDRRVRVFAHGQGAAELVDGVQVAQQGQVRFEPPEPCRLLLGPALGGPLPGRIQGNFRLGRVTSPLRRLALAQQCGHGLGVAAAPVAVVGQTLLVLKLALEVRRPSHTGLLVLPPGERPAAQQHDQHHSRQRQLHPPTLLLLDCLGFRFGLGQFRLVQPFLHAVLVGGYPVGHHLAICWAFRRARAQATPAQRDEFRVSPAAVQPRIRLGEIAGRRPLEDFPRRLAAERGLSGQDRTQDASEREHIGASVSRFASGLLRGHVGWRPHHLARLCLVIGRFARLGLNGRLGGVASLTWHKLSCGQSGLVGGFRAVQLLCQSPVHDLHFTERPDHDIDRLQVAVDDAPAVGEADRLAHLRERLEQPWPVGGLHLIGQSLADDEFHGQERRAVQQRSQRVDRWDARMRQPGGDFRLADEAAGIGLGQQDLEGDVAVEAEVVGYQNLAHAATGDLMQHAVAGHCWEGADCPGASGDGPLCFEDDLGDHCRRPVGTGLGLWRFADNSALRIGSTDRVGRYRWDIRGCVRILRLVHSRASFFKRTDRPLSGSGRAGACLLCRSPLKRQDIRKWRSTDRARYGDVSRHAGR